MRKKIFVVTLILLFSTIFIFLIFRYQPSIFKLNNSNNQDSGVFTTIDPLETLNYGVQFESLKDSDQVNFYIRGVLKNVEYDEQRKLFLYQVEIPTKDKNLNLSIYSFGKIYNNKGYFTLAKADSRDVIIGQKEGRIEFRMYEGSELVSELNKKIAKDIIIQTNLGNSFNASRQILTYIKDAKNCNNDCKKQYGGYLSELESSYNTITALSDKNSENPNISTITIPIENAYLYE